MSPPLIRDSVVVERRNHFRAYIRNFNPSAPPIFTMEGKLLVETRHDPVNQQLAVRAELEPGSQQLIVGGIGSGKTTELLLAERSLNQQADTLAFYIDISLETDLLRFAPGALLASLGLRLYQSLSDPPDDLSDAWASISQFALGTTEIQEEVHPFEAALSSITGPSRIFPIRRKTVQIPGKLVKPQADLFADIRSVVPSLRRILEAVQKKSSTVIGIVDGLDRLMRPEQFWAVAEQDFKVLRSLSISLIATAPLSVLFGTGRQVADHFDRVRHIPATQASGAELEFLKDILRQRGSGELMSEQEEELLAKASGGVLRDLIALARNSGEEAYLSGSSTIETEHVNRAILQLGETYRLGLGLDQVAILKKLAENGSFSPSDPAHLELLLTRRVLEYPSHRYAVHPALMPLLN